MTPTYCPRCGTAVPDDAVFCPRCGAPLPPLPHGEPAPAAPGGHPHPLPPEAHHGTPPPPAGESGSGAALGTPPPAAPSPPSGWAAASAAPPPSGWPSTPPPTAEWAGAPAPPPQASAGIPVGYGGFWRRLIAAVIDGMLLAFVFVPLRVSIGFPLLFGMHDGMDSGALWSLLSAGMILNLVQAMIAWVYFSLMHSSSRQASLGMMAMGLRIATVDGRRISFARATGRFLATWISNLTFGIGYLIMLFTERRQTLHDLIAGTVIVRVRA